MIANFPMEENRTKILTDVIETVRRLRAPGGCPWDIAQTHQSLRQYLIEEAYEVLAVLDQINSDEQVREPKIGAEFKEELGDLLMQVLLHSEMSAQRQAFDFYDVAATLNEKLIRRHPHVFGDVKVDGVETAFQQWEKEKQKEKAKNPEASVLDGLPPALPALQKSARIIEKVTKVGFQWDTFAGPLAKLDEEFKELRTEIEAFERLPQDHPDRKLTQEKMASEMGDLLFTVANLSYLLKINPEAALRSSLDKFDRRFRFVEKKLKSLGKKPEESNLQEMDVFWEEAKRGERKL